MFVVTVPGLNLDFLGDQPGGKFELTPLFDFPPLGLIAGQAAPAEDVFAKLKVAAKMLDEKGLAEGLR